MPRYVYILDTTAITQDVVNNVSLPPDSTGNSIPQEIYAEYAIPLTAEEKLDLDNEMAAQGYDFDREDDDANPAVFCNENIIAAVSPEASLVLGIGFTLYMPYNYKIDSIVASLSTAASAEVDVDILVDTVSIFTTTLTIDAGENTNLTAAVPYVIAAGSDFINQAQRLDIDVIANGGDGAGLKISLLGKQLQ